MKKSPCKKFLTKSEKTNLLIELDKEIKKSKVDPEIIPYLHKINSIDGICTVYSCSGHADKIGLVGGYLMLRLSRPVFDRFTKTAINKMAVRLADDNLNKIEILTHQTYNIIVIFRWNYDSFKKAIHTIIKHLEP